MIQVSVREERVALRWLRARRAEDRMVRTSPGRLVGHLVCDPGGLLRIVHRKTGYKNIQSNKQVNLDDERRIDDA